MLPVGPLPPPPGVPPPTITLVGRTPPGKTQFSITLWTRPAAPKGQTHGSSGRGEALRTCGDVEENPGPKRTTSSDIPPAPVAGNDLLDLAHSVADLAGDAAVIIAPAGHAVALWLSTPPLAPPGHFTKPVHVNVVLQMRSRVIRRVPGRVQRDLAAALAEAVNRYVSAPIDDTLFGVLALPKLCLRSCPTKGKFSISELEANLLRRLDLFRKGEWQTLWLEAAKDVTPPNLVVETRSAKRARQDPDTLPVAGVRRACTIVGEGAPAKAVQFLLSDGLHQASDPEVQAKLRLLHPPGRPVDSAALPPTIQPFEDGRPALGGVGTRCSAVFPPHFRRRSLWTAPVSLAGRHAPSRVWCAPDPGPVSALPHVAHGSASHAPRTLMVWSHPGPPS